MLENPNDRKETSNLVSKYHTAYPMSAAGPVEIYKFICLNHHQIARILVIRAGLCNKSLKPSLNIK